MPYKDYEIQKQHAREYYYKHKKSILEKRVEYYQSNRERIDATHRAWAKSNPEKVKVYLRKQQISYKKNNLEKVKAHWALNHELRVGRMKKPLMCSVCKVRNKRINGHHDDYSKPLEVRWLCSMCHSKHHKGENNVRSYK